jgi:hypothetical protein
MSNTGKVKLYKNKARNEPNNFKPYLPEYQAREIEPEKYNNKSGASIMLSHKSILPKDNPRAPRPLIRQPYAEIISSPIGRGRGLLPNVGNNMDQTWSSVDGEIDDMELDSNHQMVDNNEFVSNAALGFSEEANNDETMQVEETDFTQPQASSAFPVDDDTNEESNISDIFQNLEDNEYLLVVNGSPICSGSLEVIQEQTRGLVFGEHPLCGSNGNPMPIDDIIVLKRVQVKIGLFLE